ncbi:site-specific integrase [Massilia soli]|uniref:Site-specific integrase n=1 Tax=Massilia soli TaxID=2792854 RepID=A0ABS7SL42_9BURK|nr:site-specific integrase [Massilia soli]MBZ2206540.1 site-specific integrase [Massilia soli]
MSKTPGVEIRAGCIRIVFRYQGKQRHERLCLDNEGLAPTPANIKYATRLAAEIKDKIRLGTFKYVDYFPGSSQAKIEATPASVPWLYDVMDHWLRVCDLKASTREQYTTRMNSFWKSHLRNVPIDQVRYSDIMGALAAGSWKSAKSRNNELSMIRGPFELAIRDKHLTVNPCDEIKPKKVQRKSPDPFTLDEANLILALLKTHRPEPIYNFVQFMFFTGLRTAEGIALQWKNVDLRRNEILIEAGMTSDGEEDTTKTAQARTVILSARAHEALLRQKFHTYLQGEYVFHDPKTGNPWSYQTITDARSFWAITLKSLGIRYRRPYNMRHTYATIGLMSGAKPAFLAKQLGHSLRMFFDVYAKWISSVDDQLEMAKVNAAIKRREAPQKLR